MLPMNQQHLADTLGLSLVTFNKTLQRLRASKLFSFSQRRLTITDEPGLILAAAAEGPRTSRRPLI